MASDRLDRGSERGSGGGRWEINKTVTYLPFSPRQAYTHGISRSSIFVLTLRRNPLSHPHSVHPSALRSHHRRRPLSSSSFFRLSLFLSLFRYLAVALFPLLFVSLRFRTPRMRDLKQLKRSAKHFNLASGAPIPSARTVIYISLSLCVLRPSLFSVCSSFSIRSMPGRRRAYRAREREKKTDNGGEGWFGREAKSRIEAESAREVDRHRWNGLGKVRGRQKRAKSARRRQGVAGRAVVATAAGMA